MEDQLVQVLANTQLADEGLRKQAELDLKHAETNPAFPLSLANIACHSSVAVHIRQSALSVLRNFIEKNWQDDGPYATSPTIHVPEQVKAQIRPMLLELALGNEDEKKIKGSVR